MHEEGWIRSELQFYRLGKANAEISKMYLIPKDHPEERGVHKSGVEKPGETAGILFEKWPNNKWHRAKLFSIDFTQVQKDQTSE